MSLPAVSLPPAARPGSGGARWHVVLLGRVQAVSDSATITHWPSRACAALLARLALTPGRAHPREELAELLWPGVPLATGRARLRQTLSTLRGLLEPAGGAQPAVLVADRQTVQLSPGALDCDVLQFERHLAAKDFDAAHAVHAGELMPGFYDDWVVCERHRLVALHDGLPQPRPASVGPLRGTPPAVSVPPPGVRADTLPAYWTRAFGQGPSAACLREAVLGQRLVSLLGPGGNGKTRLAVTVAQGLIDQPVAALPRIRFVPLADAQDRDAVRHAIARTLGVTGPGAGVWPRVMGLLDEVATLLVLDNVEQLDDDAAHALATMLRDHPSLHLLLTSRRRLGLDGEQVFELPGLGLPPADADLPTAAESAAVALFVDRARASRADFRLTAHNLAGVVGLVRLLGGMPLAIELAASRLRALHPVELLERLRDGAGSPVLDLLARPGARAGAASRHASMRHVVAWSWRQLRPEVTTLLQAMSVFTAPASAEAVAQAIAGLAGPGDATSAATPAPHLSTVQAGLAEAMEASLLQTGQAPDAPDGQPGHGATGYSLLPPVREYAAEQCGADGARRVRAHLRRWLTALARARLPRDSATLRPDLCHVTPLILCADDDPALVDALALAVALRGEWNNRPIPPALTAVLTQSLQALGPDPAHDALASDAHHLLAVMHQIAGACDLAMAQAEQALARAPDDRCRALALAMRSGLHMMLGREVALAQTWLNEAQTLARRAGDPRTLVIVLRHLAYLSVNCFEDYDTATPLMMECLELSETIGDSLQVRHRQVDLATCWAWTGRESAAVALLELCITACRREHSTVALFSALSQLGRVHLRRRQGTLAATVLDEAVRMGHQSDWHGLMLQALLHLPEAWALQGHAEPAALLQGYAAARWTQTYGALNRIEARELKRTRRRLGLALGAGQVDALLLAGARMTAEQAMALLDTVPARREPTTLPEQRRSAG